jgi:hypothetical protein
MRPDALSDQIMLMIFFRIATAPHNASLVRKRIKTRFREGYYFSVLQSKAKN